MGLNALLVAVTTAGSWTRLYDLPIPPVIGLGIRLDVYDIVVVQSVLIGEVGVDVTCVVAPEAELDEAHDPQWPAALGFVVASYP